MPLEDNLNSDVSKPVNLHMLAEQRVDEVVRLALAETSTEYDECFDTQSVSVDPIVAGLKMITRDCLGSRIQNKTKGN